jgi:hypothetical protein
MRVEMRRRWCKVKFSLAAVLTTAFISSPRSPDVGLRKGRPSPATRQVDALPTLASDLALGTTVIIACIAVHCQPALFECTATLTT